MSPRTVTGLSRSIDWASSVDSHRWMTERGLLENNYDDKGNLKLSEPEMASYLRIVARTPEENEALYQEKEAIVEHLHGTPDLFQKASKRFMYLTLVSAEEFKQGLCLSLALMEMPFCGTKKDFRGDKFRANRTSTILNDSTNIIYSPSNKMLRVLYAEMEIFERKNKAVAARDFSSWFKRIEKQKGLVVARISTGYPLKNIERNFVLSCGHDPDQKMIPITTIRRERDVAKRRDMLERDLFNYADALSRRVWEQPAPEEPIPHTMVLSDILRGSNRSRTVDITLKTPPSREEKRKILENAALGGLLTYYKPQTGIVPRNG